MKRPLSNRLDDVAPSITLGVTAKANALKAQGIRVYPFGAGEPDFDVLDAVKLASIEGVLKNLSRYTSVEGLPELRSAVCDRLNRDYGLSYKPQEIIVSSGAKHSLYTAMMALASPGEEIIIPTPAWVSYIEMAKLAGIVPVLIPTDKNDGFLLDPDELKAKITPKTKALVLNNPSNPTGAVYPEDRLRAVAEVCLEAGIYIITDEIYDKFLYDGAVHVSTPSLSDEIKDISLLINGFSKTYAMPGWRVGYTAAPVEIVAAMSAIQGHCVSHPSTVSMYAAAKAIALPDSQLEGMLSAYVERRGLMGDALRAIPSVSFADPKGAFYFFVDISNLIGRSYKGTALSDDVVFCETLLNEAHVVSVPGRFFGSPGHVRFSYACDRTDVIEGMRAFADFVGELS